MKWEENVLLWIQDNMRNAVLDPICKAFAYLGAHGELVIAVTLLLMIIPKTRRTGCVCAVSLAATHIAINILIKPLVERPRPYDAIEGLTSLVGPMSDSSFPSGHTGTTFGCLFVIVLMMPKRYAIPALCFSLFMAYSRMHLGVHYPTDVLAGALLGIGFAVLFTLIYKKKFAPNAKVKEL